MNKHQVGTITKSIIILLHTKVRTKRMSSIVRSFFSDLKTINIVLKVSFRTIEGLISAIKALLRHSE